MVYKGHVTLGVGGEAFRKIQAMPGVSDPPFAELPRGNETARWIVPEIVCTVKYLEKLSNGSLRHPIFKGLREDKRPEECLLLS